MRGGLLGGMILPCFPARSKIYRAIENQIEKAFTARRLRSGSATEAQPSVLLRVKRAERNSEAILRQGATVREWYNPSPIIL
jgi:hypothetical protein